MEQTKKSFLKKNIPFLVILFALGIIFLALSEYDSNKAIQGVAPNFDERAYIEEMEKKLGAMLEKMDGVEDAKVMIALESSSGYHFSTGENGAVSAGAYPSSLFPQTSAGSKEPVVIEVRAPKIKGVSVVCRGAENIRTREKIIDLISSTLNLTTNKIYVSE